MNFFKQVSTNIQDLNERNVGKGETVVLSLQHMFAMFGATILVPLLTGLDPSVALFTSGLGTLVFHIITQNKVPAYLGSSFVFLGVLQDIVAKGKVEGGIPVAMAGVVIVGLIYGLTSILIKLIGTGFFRRLLPPVVIGPVIISIGLGLAPAVKDYIAVSEDVTYTFQQSLLTAGITLLVAIGLYLYARGIFKIIPVLVGIIAGYLFAVSQGMVDFKSVAEAAWLAAPDFTFPEFSSTSIPAISLIAPLAVATMVEHMGDVTAIGRTVKKDLINEPGLHRTLMGDGVATAIAGLLGGPPNTTYGENTGVLALTGVHNPFIILLTSIFVICFSFIGKIGALIQTIPYPVVGGISLLLFGLIANIGLRTIRENDVSLHNDRNLVIISIILVLALSGIEINIWKFSFSGMGLGAIVGILLNLILPKIEKDELDEELAAEVGDDL